MIERFDICLGDVPANHAVGGEIAKDEAKRPYVIISPPELFMRAPLVVACPTTTNLGRPPSGLDAFRLLIRPDMVDPIQGRRLDRDCLLLGEQIRVLSVKRLVRDHSVPRGRAFLKLGRIKRIHWPTVEAILLKTIGYRALPSLAGPQEDL